MFLVTGDAGTYLLPGTGVGARILLRGGARAIKSFAGSASLRVTLDIQNRTKLDISLCGRKANELLSKKIVLNQSLFCKKSTSTIDQSLGT